MTLPEALTYARGHHPEVRAALARVSAQKQAAKVPGSQWYPVFGVTAQLFAATANNTTGTYVNQSFMDIPRIGATRVSSPGGMEPYASTIAAVGGLQELFDFGRIAAQTAAEDALVSVEQERARARTLDVSFGVEESYYAVLAAKSIVKASEDAYDRAKVHRDLAKAGVDSGLRPPIELTRAEAELSQLDIGRTKARGNVSIAQAVLAAAVGVDDASLDAAPVPPASDPPSIETALARAASNDPRILEMTAQLHADEERTRAIGAEMRPDLSLTATFSGRNGGAAPSSGPSTEFGGWVPYVPNWDAGIVFSWPIYDGTVSARKAAAKAREDIHREEILAAKQGVAANVRQAWIAVDVAKTAIPSLEHAVTAAQANYVQADARFRAGLGTSVELADAEALRTEAEIQLALGQFELVRSRAALARAMAEGS